MVNNKTHKQIIVVGAGHAGLETAFICFKMGFQVYLVTLDKNKIADMPCNPSIGGPAKGVVTREIDALGGMQAIAADACQIQMKLLNSSKGAGVWALRAQIDKLKYHQYFKKLLESHKKIKVIEEEVSSLLIEDNTAVGVVFASREKLRADAVILTTGTYMKSVTHIGSEMKNEGPGSSKRSFNLSKNLKDLGFELLRLKTGTPPRILKDTIDYELMAIEPGTDARLCFSYSKPKYLPFKKQTVCYLTHTNAITHEIIRDNISKSAMFSGNISGIGPRYCPSIEDKINRFSDKPRHQIFVEPESPNLPTMYLGGLSTSFPRDIQERIVHSIKGLENCIIKNYAYAIEYDAINPIQLWPTLESKIISGLYFAGQINGTSGYEEAACQGLMAGINACLKLQAKAPLILKRSEAYIGVLINDLVTKGITDPYRLLTSRAEYRLSLRNDNADDRLISYGYELGTISKKDYDKYKKNSAIISKVISELKSIKINSIKELRQIYKKGNLSLFNLLKQPALKLKDFLKYLSINKLDDQIINKIEIFIKFEGYIKNQEISINKLNKISSVLLNGIVNYNQVEHLSLEARDKLNKIKPIDLEQAASISGVNLTDIIAIKYHIDNNKKKDQHE